MTGSEQASTVRVGYRQLWRFGGLSPLQLLRESIRCYQQHQQDARSAQFAYYSMLALAPLLIVIIACVSRLPLGGVLESFERAVDVGMPQNVVTVIETQIDDVQQHSYFGLPLIGLALLAIAGSRLFLTMGAGLDAAYGVEQRRTFWKSSGVALGLTFCVFVLLLLAMVLLVVGPMMTGFITSRVEVVWVHVLLGSGVRWGVACSFMLIATSFIYWIIPTPKLQWYIVSPGNAFATGGWVLVTQGLRIYVENFARYNETYGALAGVIVLLIWLYMTGSLLMMGGQINSVIHRAALAMPRN